MIEWLAKRLIRNREDTQSPEVRSAYGTLCGAVGIALNLLLFAAKYLAGVLSHSIAITADAFNNLSDAGSSLITLLGFRIAGKRDDKEHPYGHGRVEYLAGLAVSMLILVMGFDLAKTSFTKILHPEATSFSLISAIILGVSVLVKLYMNFYNRRVSEKIRSVAMKATATDSLSDACATFAVLVATLAARFFGWRLDGYIGLAVSLMICYGGYGAAKDTISPLLGNPPDPEFVKQIEKIVRSYPNVIGLHDLMVHDYGAGHIIVSLHAEVPANGNLIELHDIIDNIEHRLNTELRCIAVIHMDPISTDDALVVDARAKVLQAMKTALDERVTIHDFRMVAGPTHTNVVFDIVVPRDVKADDAELTAKIRAAVKDIDATWFAIADIDRPFV